MEYSVTRESISKFFIDILLITFYLIKEDSNWLLSEMKDSIRTSFNWNLYRELTAKWPKKVKALSIYI